MPLPMMNRTPFTPGGVKYTRPGGHYAQPGAPQIGQVPRPVVAKPPSPVQGPAPAPVMAPRPQIGQPADYWADMEKKGRIKPGYGVEMGRYEGGQYHAPIGGGPWSGPIGSKSPGGFEYGRPPGSGGGAYWDPMHPAAV